MATSISGWGGGIGYTESDRQFRDEVEKTREVPAWWARLLRDLQQVTIIV
jgi:hypothetical protein